MSGEWAGSGFTQNCDLCSNHSPYWPVTDTLLTIFQMDKKGEIPSLLSDPSLALPFDRPCSQADGGCLWFICYSLAMLPFWLTPFRASLSVMILVIIQDPAQNSPCPSEQPCSYLWGGTFLSTVLVTIRELFKYLARSAFHQTSLSMSASLTW